MNKELFTVFDCLGNKTRYGKDNDGGYIVVKSRIGYDAFISGGVGNDISFELDFLKENNVPDFIYDGSEFNKLHEFDKISVINKNIKAVCDEKSDNLHDLLLSFKNVFIKMDIEGHEREWLLSLTPEMLQNIKQLVIEFHGIEISEKAMSILKDTHTLVHVHGNNYGGITEFDGLLFPNVFECTYIRNSDYSYICHNRIPLPCILDQPNNKTKPDIDLNFYPFVYE